MANRNWRVAAIFHKVGEVAVIVQAPNWQGALRKAALAIKRLPVLAGRRISVGSFTLQETDQVPAQVATQQVLPEATAESETPVPEAPAEGR